MLQLAQSKLCMQHKPVVLPHLASALKAGNTAAQLWREKFGDRCPSRIKTLCHPERRVFRPPPYVFVLSRQTYYLADLLVLVSAATVPALKIARSKWLAAKVSRQVKSYTAQRPLAHCERRYNLDVSCHLSVTMTVLILTVFQPTPVLSWSFTAFWRIWRPADLRKERPWEPELSTSSPQM